MFESGNNEGLNKIIKQSTKEYVKNQEHIDELSKMLKIDKTAIQVRKVPDKDITILTIGDQSKYYKYSIEGTEAVKIMLQYALDNKNIEIIKPLIECLIDTAEEIKEDKDDEV